MESDLKSFLSEIGVSYKESGQSLITDCVNPSCGKEMHMYIRRTDGFSTCFKCHKKWKWRELISQFANCDISESYSKLKGLKFSKSDKSNLEFSLNSEIDDIKIHDDEYIELSKDFIPAEESEIALQYLISRGLEDPTVIRDMDLRWHEAMEAIIFPIYLDGYMYGWQARKVNPRPDEPRLLTKTGMNKSNYLLNYDIAKSMNEIILVEGPFDCLKVYQAGYGAVASFGMMVSQKQIDMILQSNVKKIYNGLDPDAAIEARSVTKRFLMSNKEVYRAIPPKGKKDFGECNSQEISSAMSNAVRIHSQASHLEFCLKK